MVSTTNYNAMSETSRLKKYLMWNKVRELFSAGLNKPQISHTLGLHRRTVSKYLSMTEEEFMSSQSYVRHYGHKLDPYEPYVAGELHKFFVLPATAWAFERAFCRSAIGHTQDSIQLRQPGAFNAQSAQRDRKELPSLWETTSYVIRTVVVNGRAYVEKVIFSN